MKFIFQELFELNVLHFVYEININFLYYFYEFFYLYISFVFLIIDPWLDDVIDFFVHFELGIIRASIVER